MKTALGKEYVIRQLLIVIGVILLAVLLFGLGLMIGYGVIGDAKDIWAIFSPAKWQALIDKFTG